MDLAIARMLESAGAAGRPRSAEFPLQIEAAGAHLARVDARIKLLQRSPPPEESRSRERIGPP
jgi:hypothetical protein